MTLTIDVGRRGGDIVEHHRGGNIATEVVARWRLSDRDQSTKVIGDVKKSSYILTTSVS